MYHTMAINASGELWAWGSNANWQLGVGQNTDNVISPVRIAESNIWVRVICGAVNTCRHRYIKSCICMW